MQRSRLKNIINKSKSVSNKQEVGNPFDKFKESLPIEIDNNYRLEAAWKAYGSPKDYKQALWEGMIQPIDENNYKLPSVGYNEETDEYEYLNKGKDNDIVAKDIRVWDNNVIPLVQELKLGGYVRLFNEEKDCWIYSKNKPQDIEFFKSGGKKKIKIKTHEDTYIELDSLTDDQKNGRTPVGKNSKGQDLYLGGDGIAAPLNHMPGKQKNGGQLEAFKQGGQMNVIPEGALHARKNNMELAKEGEVTHKGIPVVTNEGEQVAEIEREEIIFTKEVTDKIEKAYKKFNSEEISNKEKDELAIKIGKYLTNQIINNTDDKTNLIQKVINE